MARVETRKGQINTKCSYASLIGTVASLVTMRDDFHSARECVSGQDLRREPPEGRIIISAPNDLSTFVVHASRHSLGMTQLAVPVSDAAKTATPSHETRRRTSLSWLFLEESILVLGRRSLCEVWM